MRPTCVILTVGDEILAGYTLDTNSHWAAQRLRARGVRVVHKETLPDEPDMIAEAVGRHAAAADLVLVVGGIGPTPDDRTYEGVARGLGITLDLTPSNREALEARIARTGYGRDLLSDPEGREALERMFRLPKGAQALPNAVGAALGSWIKTAKATVVVVPGVPAEMTAMMEASVLPRVGNEAGTEAVEEVEIRGEEARWYTFLRRIEKEFPEVRVGSYPQDARGRIVLRVAGPRQRVDEVVAAVRTHAASRA